MRRILMLFLTLLLALPSMASAYNVWSITKSASPSSQAGLITPPANLAATATAGGYSTATGSMITYVTSTLSTNTATAPTTATFTVAAPPAGYTISAVTVDGVKVGSAAGSYLVSKGTKASHTISVICATQTVSLTASAVNGTISPSGTSTIPYNTGKSYTITPFAGYALSDLTVNGVTDTAALADAQAAITTSGSYTYTFSNVTSTKTLVATFALVPQIQAKIDPVTSVFNGGSVLVNGGNSLNNAGATYVWSVSPANPYVSVTATATDGGKTATFSTNTIVPIGSYTVKLDLQVGGVTKSSATAVIPVMSKADVAMNQCLSCHNTLTPTVGPEFMGSIHWTTDANEGWHRPLPDGSHEASDPEVTCAYRCHFRAASHSPYSDGAVGTADACAVCHSGALAANGRVIEAQDLEHGTKVTAAQTCMVCHSGSKHGPPTTNFKKSSHYTGDHAKLYYQMDEKACVACHNSHSLEASYGAGTANEGCQKCHTAGTPYGIYNADLTGKAPHFQAGTATNGYYPTASFIQPTGAVSASCIDCHGHNNTINAAWAESGHGKLDTEVWNSSSSHIWLDQGTNAVDYQAAPQSSNCIRCHSTQGFVQFVDSTFKNIAKIQNADGTSIKDSSPLTCNACHVTTIGLAGKPLPEGALRLQNFTTATSSKGYTARYGYKNALANNVLVNTAIYLGDNKKSNLCIPCHSQRAAGQEIKDVFAVGAFKQYSAGSAIYPHAAQPAALAAGKGGYEFTTFTAPADGHYRIGNDVASGKTGYKNTGITQGSCVGCHMTSDKSHSLAINSATYTNSCAKCHPSDFSSLKVEEAKVKFDAAVKALGSLLVAKGITQDGINPLAERKAFDMSLHTKDSTVAEKNMGAWFNWYLMKTSDPAAFAHNPSYAKKLVFDSIDWLDDGLFNSSVVETIRVNTTLNSTEKSEALEALGNGNSVACSSCHSAPAEEFYASMHWTTNANEGWHREVEPDGSIVLVEPEPACAQRCHFRNTVPAAAAAVGCGTCHSGLLPSTGNFLTGTLGAQLAHGTKVTAAQTCMVCHSGSKHGPPTVNFKKSTHYTGTYAKLDGMDQEACVACHNSHSLEASFGAGTPDQGCQKCHSGAYGIYNADMSGKAPHFQTGTATNGYYPTASFIQPTAAVSAQCIDCHGHNNTINAAWAESGHGKLDTEVWNSSASHIWLDQGTDGVNYQTAPNSSNCIRCHSTQGFVQFVDSGFTKIAKIKNADGSSIKDSSPLTCNACHVTTVGLAGKPLPEGALRLQNFSTATVVGLNKGYTARYGYKNALANNVLVNTAIYLGDNRKSNLCAPCHSQRAAGQEIKDVFAVGAFKQYSAGTAIYPHAAQPAALTAGKGGYEFTTFVAPVAGHYRIGNDVAAGTSGYMGTGRTQGTCVGCHMTSEKTHSLVINTATYANSCAKCHPTTFDAVAVAAVKVNFDATVKALGNALVAKGLTQDGINPLAERKAFDMSLHTKDNVVAEKNMGAWFNWYLMKTSDPGAYAHNPSYVKHLLKGSLDHLDDGAANGSVTAAYIGTLNLTADEQTAVISYLGL